MSNKTSAWADILIKAGREAYAEKYHEVLSNMAPNDQQDPRQQGKASVEAMLMAVAAMIEQNNTALLTEIECASDES